MLESTKSLKDHYKGTKATYIKTTCSDSKGNSLHCATERVCRGVQIHKVKVGPRGGEYIINSSVSKRYLS